VDAKLVGKDDINETFSMLKMSINEVDKGIRKIKAKLVFNYYRVECLAKEINKYSHMKQHGKVGA
jgi:hypothetical protein